MNTPVKVTGTITKEQLKFLKDAFDGWQTFTDHIVETGPRRSCVADWRKHVTHMDERQARFDEIYRAFTVTPVAAAPDAGEDVEAVEALEKFVTATKYYVASCDDAGTLRGLVEVIRAALAKRGR